jgi:hypothetical protein
VLRPGKLRLYSGQIDPADPSRFFIPFRTRTATGRLIVQWIGNLTSASPSTKVIQEDPSVATLTVEFDANVRRE